MAFAAVNGLDVHYVTQGDGPTTIVFLHGFGSCAEAWHQQFEAFSGRYRCVAYDSVNHGHSQNSPRGEPEPDRVDELEGFLAALGIERPVIAGNSMGALTLLRWAVRHPDEALGLAPSGMGVTRPGSNPAMPEATRRALTEPVDESVLFLPAEGGFTAGFPQRKPVEYERYVRLRSTATRLEASRHPRQATAVNPTREQLAGAVGGIRSPMQIVVGELDWLADAASTLHELVDGSNLDVIAGAPHNVYFEAPNEYNAVVAGFLSDLEHAQTGS